MRKVTLYEWPWSQKCMGCVHGEFVNFEGCGGSDYMCYVSCEENDGTNCPKFEQREEEKEEEENANYM